MTYIPLKKINEAIGSPEADSFVTVTEIANDIIFDKTILVTTLLSFGVPASLADDLITLINKIIPLSINYVENFSDFFPDQSATFTGNADSVTTTLTTSLTVPSISNPTLSEFFVDETATFTGDLDSGDVYLGGDATDTTKSLQFAVIDVIDGTNLQVDSTAGMSFADTVVQGIFTTSITNILDSTHLIVGSTSGWVASSLVTTF